MTSSKWMLVIAAAAALAGSHAPAIMPRAPLPQSPDLYFWAWDEPEDMQPLRGTSAGVAYLAATILLDSGAQIDLRRQPLLIAPGTPVTAVFRIQTRSGFVASAALRELIIRTILQVNSTARPRAVQIDFDATRSERVFYADLLRHLRAALPPQQPLSITALLSWCGHDDWIRGLPIQEAVPMYFRLGAEANNVHTRGDAYFIREPLCAHSIGISTDEPAAYASLKRKRVYVFAPRPWTARQLKLMLRAADAQDAP